MVCLCVQSGGLNDSANWPSLNKAADKVTVFVCVCVCVLHVL